MTDNRALYSARMQANLKRRNIFEHFFKFLGLASVLSAGLILTFLIVNITSNGYRGFYQTHFEIDVYFDPSLLPDLTSPSRTESRTALRTARLREMLANALANQFPHVESRSETLRLTRILSVNARERLITILQQNPDIIGTTQRVSLLASDDMDQAVKGNIDLSVSENDRQISDKELGWLNSLRDEKRVTLEPATEFFSRGDSSDPELAGILGAAVGSALTLFITLITALPLGVLSAVYLEEFAKRGRITSFIEVNINNLAAVPSVIYGLMGLFLFLSIMNLPRSSPLVGGLTLALMTLPTIIIASRTAIRAVPNSIRMAAAALGASRMQVVFHHVFPSALPGIMTGSIIGMSRALGETAPLLMIGMIAFIVEVPGSINEPATVLPVQIYLWSDSSERAFVEKTSAAIMVLLGFLILMNALAVWVRHHFEKRL